MIYIYINDIIYVFLLDTRTMSIGSIQTKFGLHQLPSSRGVYIYYHKIIEQYIVRFSLQRRFLS